MDIKRRKKYFLALAQTASTPSPASPISPTSPTSPNSPASPKVSETPKVPITAFDTSIFRNLNTLWQSSNAEKIKQIINLLNAGLHIVSLGAVNMNTIKNNNFDFSKAKGLMPNSPGINVINFVESFYKNFSLISATKDGVSELTAQQKKEAVDKTLSSFNSLMAPVRVTDPTFNKENIRTLLNTIDVNLQPTVKTR